MMINALNNNQQEPYSQIQNKRQSSNVSKIQTPRGASGIKPDPQDIQNRKENLNNTTNITKVS